MPRNDGAIIFYDLYGFCIASHIEKEIQVKNGLLLLGKFLAKGVFLVVLFFAVTTMMIHIISVIDTRYAKRGNTLHPYFRVAVFDASDGTFKLAFLPEAKECSKNGACYLIPEKDHGRVDGENGKYSAYELLEKNETRVILQTISNDDENTFWYIYSVDNNNGIVPVKTKMLYFGYVFPAMGMALLFVGLFGVYGFALLAKLFNLRKRVEGE
ncbi:MAG: hypothetical protein LBP52_09355 [Burkholderiaceae bacterium]|jgi:hypothetical protein|nr:hypothetical protein [Burkholderiaceae bacterium]